MRSRILTEDLRIDVEELKNLDKDIVSKCVEVGRKKGELLQLLKFLENLSQTVWQ